MALSKRLFRAQMVIRLHCESEHLALSNARVGFISTLLYALTLVPFLCKQSRAVLIHENKSNTTAPSSGLGYLTSLVLIGCTHWGAPAGRSCLRAMVAVV